MNGEIENRKSPMRLNELSAWDLRERIRNHEVTSRAAAEAVLSRIEEIDGEINAFITVTAEEALRQADEVDHRIESGEEVGPLSGVPIAIKDLICTRGIRTTCGSGILEPFVPPYDATVVERLRSADAIFVGKTNMDEFAMGSSTENSHFSPTRNPRDLERVPGGSSGGSASAVAAEETILALGSDTGGSIRQPASFCGIVGLKPTYGRVSRFGLVAYASSLDQIGPMTKDVRDAALLLGIIAGPDRRDSTCADVPVPDDYPATLDRGVEGMRIGLPREYFEGGLDEEVKEAVLCAADELENAGAERIDISLPHTEYAIAAYYIIATAEASANLARYDGVKYGFRAEGASDLLDMYAKTRSQGFGEEVKRRIMLGTYALSAGYYDAYYLKAQRVRTLIKRDFERAFEICDLLLTPVAPTPAFRIGEKIEDPLQLYLSDIYTVSANLAGIPGLSVPCGASSDGLPIGVQILGGPFDEERVLRAGYVIERSLKR